MLDNKNIELQYNIVEFQLVNPTNTAIAVNLFDTSILADTPNSPTVATLQFYITGTANYNQFVRDNMVNPKKLDRLMIYAQSTSNLDIPILVNFEDATGNTCRETFLPSITVSPYQYKGGIGQLDFKDVVLDVETTISTTIPKRTTIKWVLFYKQYNLSNMLSAASQIKTICPQIPQQAYDEKTLMDTALVIPNWTSLIEVKNLMSDGG